MIYTRLGNMVWVQCGHEDKGMVCVKYIDGTTQIVNIADLKADGGIAEIMAKIKEVR